MCGGVCAAVPIGADTPYRVVAVFLFIEGAGMGPGMQVLVLVVQNEFSVAEVGSADAITPALVSGLDDALQSLVQLAYNDALAPVFATLVPVLLAAFALLLLMCGHPLKMKNE